jgi:cytochrome c biogenesis protein CcmG/thiol:disulfide interchange protein DsbE
MSAKVMSFLPLLALPLVAGGWVVVNGMLGTCPMCTTIMESVTGTSSATVASIEGESVFDLSAASLDGQPVALKEFSGKPMLIDFWATWCYPCRQQREILAGMQDELRDKVTVLAVSMDDEVSAVRSHLAESGAIGEELFFSDSLKQRFDVQSIPMLVFVDAEGRVHSIDVGVHDADEIRAKVSKLAGPALASAE